MSQRKTRVLVIGGYGNFGQFICRQLVQDAQLTVIVAGRSLAKAERCVQALQDDGQRCEAAQLDIRDDLASALERIAPNIVIHTSGPFQNQRYHVAEACVDAGCHYIDLADGREFVAGIHQLDRAAQLAGVLVCSGASSVPGLSSALIEHYQPQFSHLTDVDYGISTAHRTSRGLATTQAVLSYAGKPFTTVQQGQPSVVRGWRDTRALPFWQLGTRCLGNCDIPDLALFPQRYPSLRSLRFQAGLELSLIHRTLAALAWMAQYRLLPNLRHLAKPMLWASRLFDRLGTERSGFFMTLSGTDASTGGQPLKIRFDLVAHQGDGLYIPTIPAVVIARKLAHGQLQQTGAMPCMGLITLDEYLNALAPLAVEWQETRQESVE